MIIEGDGRRGGGGCHWLDRILCISTKFGGCWSRGESSISAYEAMCGNIDTQIDSMPRPDIFLWTYASHGNDIAGYLSPFQVESSELLSLGT